MKMDSCGWKKEKRRFWNNFCDKFWDIFLQFFLLPSSVTRLGDFLKFLVIWLLYKVAQKAWWILGLKWNATLFMLNSCDYFLGNIWKNLAYFLIQHLVTLLPSHMPDHSLCVQLVFQTRSIDNHKCFKFVTL